MNKVVLSVIVATIALLFTGVYLLSKQSSSESTTALTPPTTIEYYWGDGCPHCAKVDEFLNSWSGKDKVEITKKEVWNNIANANMMQARAKACGVTPSGMGVPFLVTLEGKCIVGDGPIIEFFKSLNL